MKIQIIKTASECGNSTDYMFFEPVTGRTAEVKKVYDFDHYKGKYIGAGTWKLIVAGKIVKCGAPSPLKTKALRFVRTGVVA